MEKFSIKTAPQFERHYDESDFWRKVRRVAAQAGAKVLYPALQLFFLLQSKKVPIKAKTLIIGALGYLILPVDLMPDFIPAMGFTDDLTDLMLALHPLPHTIPPEKNQKAQEPPDTHLPNRTRPVSP